MFVRSWIPIVVGIPLLCASAYLSFRFIPLVTISRREVQFHRALLAVFVIGAIGWAVYHNAAANVAL